ncbi:MAG: bifunctional 4-hydroxy-2-oxoglutarate aldolase/2-dehydro-3-deoxy-phosphogluconate aldolase [Clostridiales bacterium]|nr:bifunctional 4-hydroxy-2-oxoglutarate aldolase/2-dehydro-3-deoxy-phosphogluconate aldolase [Clostridiales bacterium]
MSFYDDISKAGIVPVVVIENAEDAVPTARALLAGGIKFMEITFRTACAGEAIDKVAKEVPEMYVGAGTVITVEQAQSAVKKGARFIVSPGFPKDVVAWCQENAIPVCPGCVTPTEIIEAVKCGLKVVKFFPAGVYGGIKAVKALASVFGDVKFLPTGGIDAGNMVEYLGESSVIAIGGSWVCTKKDIRDHEFEKITKLSREAVDTIAKVKEA